MLKREVFVRAMKTGRWKFLDWTIRAFALTNTPPPKPEDYSLPLNDLRLFHDATGHYVIFEKQLLKIEDGDPTQPLYQWLEALVLEEGDIPNQRGVTGTTYGNFFFNWCVMAYAFGNKLPYQEGHVSPSAIQKLIRPRLIDDPQLKPKISGWATSDKDPIYVSEYLRYADALFFLTGMTQLCVQGTTKKVLLPPPGIKEYRAKLLEENKDHLTELATIAKIDKQLIEYDAQWLKGDPGEKFLISGKARNIVRRKKFLMGGAEVGLAQNAVHGTLIVNSLHEGWDLTKFPIMNDSSRSGSHSRGALTMLGGVSVKWLLRASSNVNVTIDDCGSKLGLEEDITSNNWKNYVGFTLILNGKQEHIRDEEAMEKYLGKKVMVRSSVFCKLPHTDYCKTCVGDRLSVNPTGVSIAVSDYGSKMLGMFMSAMHGKALKTAEMVLEEVLS